MKLNYFLIIFLVVLFVILLPVESDSIISFNEKQNENDKTPLVFI